VVAGIADQRFLLAADAVDHRPGLVLLHDLSRAFVGPDLHVNAHRAVHGDDAVHGRARAHKPAECLLVVVLEEPCQLRIDGRPLHLVDADDEGQQAEAPPGRNAPGFDQTPLGHADELPQQCARIPARARRDLVARLERQP